jgi:dTDP-glucose pyrophosphorylase
VQRKLQTVLKLAKSRLDTVRVSSWQTIGDIIKQLDQAGTGALLLCEETGEFTGLLTDGDIRRGFLRGLTLQDHCFKIATRKPFVATMNQSLAEMLQLMDRADINHLPLVDDTGRALGLIRRQDLRLHDVPVEMSAVIMAGGLGTRLMPLTNDTPKPMLPVGDRPLLEHTIERLRQAGVRRVNVTTHHLPEKITQHFRDGSEFGVELNYVNEENPLGTAGGLRFIGRSAEPILVLNGDILTSLRYPELLAFHRENHADLTIGVRVHEVDVPYGVIECDGTQVKGIKEKPKIRLLLNAGVYVLEPFVSYFIPDGRRCDMTDLIKILLESGRKVVGFPIMEYWLDIGQRTDYDRANEDIRLGRL